MKRANSAGVMPLGIAPWASRRSFRAGVSRAFAVSCWTRSMISGGVPVGASSPNHELASKPLTGPGFGDRRHVRQCGASLRARHRERGQLAGLDLRQRRRQVVEHQVHRAADQVEQRRPGAAVGEVEQVGAGHALEQLAAQMDRGAVAARRHVQLARIRARVADQVGDVLDAGGLRLGRVHHQHVRHPGHHRDRRQVLERVEWHLRIERRIDRLRADRAHQQRVAVGRRLRDEVGAEVAAGTRLVVDDEGLAERLAELRRERARQDVGGAAGRERHDDADRLRGPGAGRRRRRLRKQRRRDQRGRCGEQDEEVAADRVHGETLGVTSAQSVSQQAVRPERACPRRLFSTGGRGGRPGVSDSKRKGSGTACGVRSRDPPRVPASLGLSVSPRKRSPIHRHCGVQRELHRCAIRAQHCGDRCGGRGACDRPAWAPTARHWRRQQERPHANPVQRRLAGVRAAMRWASVRTIGSTESVGWPTRSNDDAPPRQLGPPVDARRSASAAGACRRRTDMQDSLGLPRLAPEGPGKAQPPCHSAAVTSRTSAGYRRAHEREAVTKPRCRVSALLHD